MSTSTLAYPASRSLRLVLADYLELTKPRIASMVLVTVTVAAFVADWGPPGGALLLLEIVLAQTVWRRLP